MGLSTFGLAIFGLCLNFQTLFLNSLIDLPLEGATFTWSNSREVVLWSRLDMFLLSSDLEEYFPNIRQKRLHRLLSNHFPIL